MNRTSLLPWVTALGYLAGCNSATDTDDPNNESEVPQLLLDVEGGGEDAFDFALLDDSDHVAEAAAEIDTAWRSFRSEAIRNGATAADAQALDDAIASLRTAATAGLPPIELARSANAISAPMNELFALYQPIVPAGVLELDYLGREVVLDALAGAPTSAEPDSDRIESGWARLRQTVIDAGGESQAADMDLYAVAIAEAIAAGDSLMLVNWANVFLDHVDKVEGVFEGPE